MRFWNEVATIFLISIVFIVILRDTFSWLKGLAGLIAFSLVLVGAIRVYKGLRK